MANTAACGTELINKIRSESERESIPSVSDATGRFLEMLATVSNAKNIVEIGCANGCATCYLLNAARKTGGRVTAFEKDARRFEMAKFNLRAYTEAGTLRLIAGDALEKIGEFKTGPNEFVDFLFIDAMKRQYKPLLEAFMPMLAKGAIVFSDDVFFRGVLEPEKTLERHKTIVRGLREYLDYLKNLEGAGVVENYFYGHEDGMAVTRIL